MSDVVTQANSLCARVRSEKAARAAGISERPEGSVYSERLSALVAEHRAFATAYPRTKERDNSEKYGSKYIVGFADWYGSALPAVLNTETGLTSKPMSRTFAQRLCASLNYHEFRGESFIDLHCELAKVLRRLHGLPEEYIPSSFEHRVEPL